MQRKMVIFALFFVLCIPLVPGIFVHASDKDNVYIVKKGDCLSKIANKKDMSWKKLAQINKIKPPYTIYKGQKLKLQETKSPKFKNDEKTTEPKEAAASKSKKDENSQSSSDYSDWALKELVVGDTYGIYPLTWYQGSMTTGISKEQMKELVNGLDTKIRKADGVKAIKKYKPCLKKNMSVEEVLNEFYSVINSNSYPQKRFISKSDSPISFMKKTKVFKEKAGELALKDKCSVEQACVFATRIISMVYDKNHLGSKGFLWEAKSGKTKAYLLGSIHMATTDIYPFGEEIQNAYKKSDALVVEVNLYNDQGNSKFASLASYEDQSTLKDHISAENYKKVLDAAKTLGFTEKTISAFKPWALSSIFTTFVASGTTAQNKYATSASLGIDMSLMSDAIINNKTILEIEGYEKQGKMFDGFSAGLQEHLLASGADKIRKMQSGKNKDNKDAALLKQWLKNWHNGDFESFKKTFNVKEQVLEDNFENADTKKEKAYTKEYYNALLTKRNKEMVNYIDTLLSQNDGKTYFVVVGSLHYLGEDGILNSLKESGYTITRK